MPVRLAVGVWLTEGAAQLERSGAATVLVAIYFVVLGLLALYGLHRLWLVWRYARCRDERPTFGTLPELPRVTVQLPFFNEAIVAERAIRAACALDYPPGKLQIQVLDDSTDGTREVCARIVKALAAEGASIQHLHRSDRLGYKAGALEAGLCEASGALVCVFDADFVPPEDFLARLVPYFADPGIGCVQARWGHLNAERSGLTRAQALLLDAHFLVEHHVRNRRGHFFNFNGTAGIWRRAAIETSGGWQHDTLTEDLDLSYRAQLAGWRFLFVPDVVAPAELPGDMNAFKTQQYRWTKGSIQCAKKLVPRLWRARLPLGVKLDATIHLTANVTAPLLVALAVLLVPAIAIRRHSGTFVGLLAIDLPIFILGTLAVCDYLLAAQRTLGREFVALRRLPLVIALGMGLSLNNARAVFSALFGRVSPFVRTPKQADLDSGGAASISSRRAPVVVPGAVGGPSGGPSSTPSAARASASSDGAQASRSPDGAARRRPRAGWWRRRRGPLIELALGLYFFAASAWAVWVMVLPSLPFLLAFAVGFTYVGWGSLRPPAPAPSTPAGAP